MSRIILIVLAALLLAFPVQASQEDFVFRDWTSTDVALEVTFLAVLYQDWQQTRAFRAEGVRERNPILGPEPSPERVNLLIGGAAIGHILVADYLGQPERRAWQWLWIVVETAQVIDNQRLGWSLRF